MCQKNSKLALWQLVRRLASRLQPLPAPSWRRSMAPFICLLWLRLLTSCCLALWSESCDVVAVWFVFQTTWAFPRSSPSFQLDLDDHTEKRHLRRLSCKYCPPESEEGKFATKELLFAHMKAVHPNDKCFVCDQCNYVAKYDVTYLLFCWLRFRFERNSTAYSTSQTVSWRCRCILWLTAA